MSDAVVHSLAHRSLIRLEGDGVAGFLQDLITASVTDIPEGTARHAALLSPQGRILFDLVVTREDDAFLLECDRDRSDELLRRLKLYRMRLPIEIGADNRSVMAAEGEIAGGCRDPRFSGIVTRFYTSSPPAATADADAWKRLRWRDGIAEGGEEIPPEKALPLEIRLELDDGIGFDKGCYIGQEVTARTSHRGLVKRSYAPVRIDGPLEAPAQLLAGGKDAGTLLSAVADDDGMLGLASVRLEYLGGNAAGLTADGRAVSPFLPDRLKPLPGKR